MILPGFLQRLGLVLVRLHGLVIRFLRLVGGSLQIPGLLRGLLGFLSGLPRGLLGGGQRLGRIGSVLCGLLALGQCGLVCGVGSGQGITVGSQISQVCVNVHDAARVGADSVSVFGEQLTMGVPADTRDVAVLADAETGEGQIGVDQRGVMAISAGFDGLAVRGLAIQDTVGHVLLIHGLLRVVPALKGISVTPGEVFAGGELKWMVHVVVGIIRIRHGLCHQGVTDLEGLQAFLRAKLIGFLDELQGLDHVVQRGRITLGTIMNGVKILGDGRIGENLDCLRGTLVAEVGHCALRQLVLSLVCRFLLGVGLALGIGGGLLLRLGVGRGVGHRLVGILLRLFRLLLGGGGVGCGLLRRFELRGQVGKTSIILGQLLDLGIGLLLGFKRLGLGLPGRIQLGLRDVHRLVGLRLVAGRRGLLLLGRGQLLLGGGLVGRGLLRVRVGPAGLLLRITDGGICVIGLLLRVRGLLVGRINIGLGLVGVLLMGGGFGGGLILRGLCGLLVGFALRLVAGGLLHGLVGVVDGVGRVVRGLLGGGDLVGRAGRILCGLLLGLVGVVVVRLRLLLVVCGCLLLGGGVVEVLLGGVQCGCGGVGLGLCFGHAGRGCLCDGLVGFGGALLCLLDAVLGLCDCLIGLVAGGCGFVGHCDCRSGKGCHHGGGCHCDLGDAVCHGEFLLSRVCVFLFGFTPMSGDYVFLFHKHIVTPFFTNANCHYHVSVANLYDDPRHADCDKAKIRQPISPSR